MAKINLESYKGVRDFYPEDKAIQNYIFSVWAKVVESYGYQNYDASILEPLELYKSKSSEEIVENQIYSFKDRGDREVALRPEMTPTVARMIGAKWQDLPAPIRWYSTPNLFRYEKPQRGRLREHWQLNVDLFGVSNTVADIEVISLASKIMTEFGAKSEDFIIKVNDRSMMESLYETIDISKDDRQKISRIIDKKEKITDEVFKESIKEIIGEGKLNKLTYVLDSGDNFLEEFKDNKSAQNLKLIIDTLRSRSMVNVQFSPTLTRGFDYYTGIVFEVFDTNRENSRSLFGGGRYDNLVGLLTGEEVPAIGFGMGDVTIADFLQTHNLLPKISATIDLWLCIAPDTDVVGVENFANKLREVGLNIGVDISSKKLDSQLKSIDKRNVSFLSIIGKDELESGKFKIRNSFTREEVEVNIEDIEQIKKILIKHA